MALKEIPEQEDFVLYEIMRHPIFCWEFIQNVDKLPHEEEFIFSLDLLMKEILSLWVAEAFLTLMKYGIMACFQLLLLITYKMAIIH